MQDIKVEPIEDLPNEADSDTIRQTITASPVRSNLKLTLKNIEQDMKVEPIKDSPNEAHLDTLTPNHNGMSSSIEFESNTVDHVQLSKYFLVKSIEPDIKVKPNEESPNEKRPNTITRNHSDTSSPFESKIFDYVQHSRCYLFKNIEQDIKVGPKEDFLNKAHPDTINSNRKGRSSTNNLNQTPLIIPNISNVFYSKVLEKI